MGTLKYKVIKSEKQYDQYCKIIHDLVFSGNHTKEIEDEIDLLEVLIGVWDDEHYPVPDAEPIELLLYCMEQSEMKAKDLAELLGVSKGYVSEILNYKKGLSKQIIRKLADRFKIREEAFSRPYRLDTPKEKLTPRAKPKPAKIVSTRKKLRKAV